MPASVRCGAGHADPSPLFPASVGSPCACRRACPAGALPGCSAMTRGTGSRPEPTIRRPAADARAGPAVAACDSMPAGHRLRGRQGRVHCLCRDWRCADRSEPRLCRGGDPRQGSAAGQALDVAQEVALLRVAERDGDAGGAGACRAADAVDIALRHVRQLELHDVRDLVDVDAARGDVGGDQGADLGRP